jgi:8-oxo-dGTP diphosphatase
MAKNGADRITAAGGVVWRRDSDLPELLLAHRPRYNDWTLPKGKVHSGESELAAAVREVREETGFTGAVQHRVGTTKYVVDSARKRVTFWSMRCSGGQFVPNDEVDEICWLPPADAADRLTYDSERSVAADWASTPAPDSLIILVRHAKAGRRGDWHGDDRLRPLDANGERQAQELAALLALFEPTGIWSADLLRCEQTVAPLADKLGLQLQVESAFADDNFEDGADGTALRLMALARRGCVSVVCSQGESIPALVDRLGPGVRSSETKKGAWWVLPVIDGDVIVADYYDAP